MKAEAGSASVPEAPTPRLVGLADALDLPPELVEVQNAYWRARRRWTELQHAYLTVIEDMVEHLEGQ